MEKNIKDYLHLYIGCDVLRPDGRTILKLYGIQGALAIHAEGSELTYSSLHACKPILRMLSDMTQQEATLIAEMIYESIYGSREAGLEFVNMVEPESDDSAGFIFEDGERDRIGLTIEVTRGIEFSVNGTKVMVRQFDLLPNLLSCGFDLFGLIESGLAIDKTKITANL